LAAPGSATNARYYTSPRQSLDFPGLLAHDEYQRENEAWRRPNGWEGIVLGGTYKVLGRLGKGGMGEIYEAEHLRLGKRVAVKFMKVEDADHGRALHRFEREVRALAALTNEHVVSVFDCGDYNGEVPYLVMERLEGEDLRSLVGREKPLSLTRAVRFALDACAGLSAVHAAALIHRDLKPANLFITTSITRGELCKILDFGVAKASASDATSEGSVVGTVRYMAPEQLSDSASVAVTADVYAVAAILYETLTGRPPYDASTTQELMFEILNRDPPRLAALRPDLPAGLSEVVVRAMSKDPADRHQSAAELARALRPFAAVHRSNADDTTFDNSALDRTVPRTMRRPNRFAVITALLALISGIAVGLAFGRARAWNDPPTAVHPPRPPTNLPIAGQRQEVADRPLPIIDTATSSSNPARDTEVRTHKAAPSVSSQHPQRTRSHPAPVVLDLTNPYDEQ
jgi:eukaryotic-like serine/threonine-protein kinase